MYPYSTPIVTAHVLELGYREAVERFREAARSDNHALAFIPLFEALNWAAVIDDRCAAHFVPDGVANKPGRDWQKRLTGRETLRAVRFARNRVHHEWDEAVVLDGGVWVWRAVDDLPASFERGKHGQGRRLYEEELAGQPVDTVLGTLGKDFKFVVELLEPIFRQRHTAPY